MSTILSDLFAGATSGANLTAHTAATGNTWSSVNGLLDTDGAGGVYIPNQTATSQRISNEPISISN